MGGVRNPSQRFEGAEETLLLLLPPPPSLLELASMVLRMGCELGRVAWWLDLAVDHSLQQASSVVPGVLVVITAVTR